MAHNDRFYRPTILAPMWTPTPSQIRALDQQTSESIDGDNGGTWNPATPIGIGGAGVNLGTAGGFTGGVTTGAYAPPGALRLGNNDYPIHVVPKTRKIVYPIRDAFWSFRDLNALPGGAEYDQSVPGRFVMSGGTVANPNYTSMNFDNRLSPGATIAEVRLRLTILKKPATVPTALPSFYFANAAASEQKTMAAPATVDAYYNNGLPQDIVLVPSVLTTVDPAQYYFFQFSDTTGAASSIAYHSVTVTLTNIVDMRPGL